MPAVYDVLVELAGDRVSPTALQALWRGWQIYFVSVERHTDVEQLAEFRAIMRARVQSGSITLVAPLIR